MEFPLLIFAYLLISALLVVSIYIVRKGKSAPIQGQVLFQESLTYGRHLTGPLGVFGSQANSLEVTLTDKYFYIRPLFPFNLVNLGLEWIVPLQEIFDIEVLKKNFLSPNRIQLTFHDAKGKIQKIEFKVSNPERFLEAMELAQGTRFHFLQAEKCAYCKEVLVDAIDSIRCAKCSTLHHRECFSLNGKCTVFGCDSKSTTEVRLVPKS